MRGKGGGGVSQKVVVADRPPVHFYLPPLLRPSLNEKLFPVFRPTGFKRRGQNLFS